MNDHTDGVGKDFAWLDFSGSTDRNVILESDVIDVSALATPELNFFYNCDVQGTLSPLNALYIEVFNGTTWVTLDTILQNNANIWSEHTYNLKAYVSAGNVTVRFRGDEGGSSVTGGTGSGFVQDHVLDDITVRECPTCPTGVNNAGISNLTPTMVCAGSNNFSVDIKNAGTNQISNVMVNWSVNGVAQTAISHTTLLDTLGGTGSDMATIALGSVSVTGLTTIKAWTAMPNGMTDTVNGNDTTEISISPSLNGTYTINAFAPPTGGNYQSFAAAIADLDAIGVCGPTVFNVVAGTYNEQINLGNIPGASSVNTITFNGTGATSIINFAPTSSAVADMCVVCFDGSEYVTFDNFTVNNTNTSGWNRVVSFTGSNNHVTISNNTLNGTAGTTTSTWSAIVYNDFGVGTDSCTIDNNIMNDGSYGAYWMGGNTTTFENGNSFTNNTINNPYYSGIFWYYQDGGTVSNNSISTTSVSTTTSYGIYSFYGNSDILSNNIKINSGNTIYGLYIYRNIATATNTADVANNMVITSSIPTTSSHYGLYLREGKYVNLYHNSLSVPGGGTSSAALYVLSSTSTLYGDVNIQNNIFSRTGASGYAMYSSSTAIGAMVTSLDYNAYQLGTGTRFRYPTTLHTTFAAYQTAALANGDAANSVEGNPGFLSPTDLHVQGPAGSNAGNNAVGITTDIDGDARPLLPDAIVDMGADEYNVPPCPAPSAFAFSTATATTADFSWTPSGTDTGWIVEWGPVGFTPGTGTSQHTSTASITVTGLSPQTNYDAYLRGICSTGGDTSVYIGAVPFRTGCVSLLAGTYTLDPSMPVSATNYVTMTAWMNDLMDCGISAAVTLNVAAGSGPYMMGQELGAINGASSTNTVTMNGAGNVVNRGTGTYFLALNGTEHLTINDFMFINETPATPVFGIHMRGGCDSVSITNNTIDVGTSTSTLATGIVVSGSLTSVFTAGNNADNCTISGNTLTGGYAGVFIYGQSSVNRTPGHTISNNIITKYSTYGMRVYYTDDIVIEGNDIQKDLAQTSTSYGIYMYYYMGAKIRKNKIQSNGTNTQAYGMYIRYSRNTATSRTEISNNILTNFTGTSTQYGIRFLDQIRYTDIVHNTFDLSRPAGGTRYCLYNTSGSFNLNLKNNIFNIAGPGNGTNYGVYLSSSSSTGSVSENNLFNIVANGTKYFGRWASTTNRTTLAAWQTATGNTTSQSGDPIFASPTNLTPLSMAVDNGGATGTGIADDYNNAIRSTTTPDFGAIEFVGVPGDISLDNIWLEEQSFCLGTTDSAYATISNVFGATVNFATDPMVVNWAVTGPNNSFGTFTINTGTLAAGASMDVFATTIDMSMPGIYTVSAAITATAVNAASLNDTLLMHATFDKKPVLAVTPQVDTLFLDTDSVTIAGQSKVLPGSPYSITEIGQWTNTTTIGTPVGGKPTWFTGDDYVEISGIPNTDLAGMSIEIWGGTARQVNYTFPAGTVISPNGTAIISTSGGTTSAANYYYSVGTGRNNSSFTSTGQILKAADGSILDATVHGTYTFPAASGVTAADWSGSTSTSGGWGMRRQGPDANNATNWVLTTTTTPRQDPGVLNTGVAVPTPPTYAGLTWTDLSTSTGLGNNTSIVAGPFTSNGTYQYEASLTGCSSPVKDTASITVYLRTFDTTVMSACDTFFTPIGGAYHRLSGFYYDTTQSTSGFIYDSLINVYDVTVNYSNGTTINPAQCDSFVSPLGRSLKVSGTYYDTLMNGGGCDSVVTINLTITTTTFVRDTAFACDNYMWRGTNYTSAGSYNDTVFTGSCDSIYVLELSMGYTSMATFMPSVCDSFVSPSGKVWKTTGTYMDTITNASGCDSVMTFNLTVNYNTYYSYSKTVCDMYMSPSGKNWTTTGMYMDTIANAKGCDSVMTINLTVNYSVSRTDNINLCPGKKHRVGPNLYTTAGTYTDVFATKHGCDSTIITNLSYYAPATNTITYNFCKGDSVIINGNWYYSATSFVQTIVGGSSKGCDSIITHNVTTRTVTPPLNLGDDVIACLDGGATVIASTNYDTYLWSNGGTTNVLTTLGSTSGIGNTDYILTVTQASSGCTARDTVNIEYRSCVGISEVDADLNVNLYPNPASDFVTIEIFDKFNTGNLKLEILNSIGQVVYTQNVTNANQKVVMDINNFSKGLYLVRISSDKLFITKKLLIQK